jgi:hypothetical protein
MALLRRQSRICVDRVRPQPSIYAPRETADWTAVTIAAWVLGVALVMFLCFRYAGRGEPIEEFRQPPLVPPTLRFGEGKRAMATAETIAAATERARIAAEDYARSRVVAETHAAASYRDDKFQYVMGAVHNNSDLTVASWRAILRFFGPDGRELSHRDTKSTKPIFAGKSRGFKIRHPLVPGAARANLVLYGVKFRQ